MIKQGIKVVGNQKSAKREKVCHLRIGTEIEYGTYSNSKSVWCVWLYDREGVNCLKGWYGR